MTTAASAGDGYEWVEKTVMRKGKPHKQWYRIKIKGSKAAVKLAEAAKPPSPAEQIMKEKVGGQLGSNEGGTYLGADGTERYVKFYKDPAQAAAELAANKVYSSLGLAMPEVKLFQSGDRTALASTLEAGKKLSDDLSVKSATSFMKGFAADVLTANWDAAGLTLDNAIVKPDGTAVRIDTGGTFLKRAQGANKPEHLLNEITEWEGFLDPKINKSYSGLAKQAGVTKAEDLGQGLVEQVKKINAVRAESGDWHGFLKANVPELAVHPEQMKQIGDMLEARTQKINAKIDAMAKSQRAQALAKAAPKPTTTEPSAAAQPPAPPGYKWVMKDVLRKGKIYKQWFKVKDKDVPGTLKAQQLKKIIPPKTPEEKLAEINQFKKTLPGEPEEDSGGLLNSKHSNLRDQADANWKKLTPEQKQIMISFTGSSSMAIRLAQAGPAVTEEFARAHQWSEIQIKNMNKHIDRWKSELPHLEAAQAQMSIENPTQHAPLWRGMKVTTDTLHAMLTGEAITHNGFDTNSTSYTRGTAEGFMSTSKDSPRPHQVLIKYTKVKKGTNMMFSENGNLSEREIALGKGTFRITKRQYVKNPYASNDSSNYFLLEVEQEE